MPKVVSAVAVLVAQVVTVLCRCERYTVRMAGQPITFIVRLTRPTADTWAVVIERVRTREKRRVDDVEAIGRVIARMVELEARECPGEEHSKTRPEIRGGAA